MKKLILFVLLTIGIVAAWYYLVYNNPFNILN